MLKVKYGNLTDTSLLFRFVFYNSDDRELYSEIERRGLVSKANTLLFQAMKAFYNFCDSEV